MAEPDSRYSTEWLEARRLDLEARRERIIREEAERMVTDVNLYLIQVAREQRRRRVDDDGY